jgi:hypothetical protein
VSKVTREIRKSLKMKDICDATTEQCAALFGSDECRVYCCERPTTDEGLQQSAGRDEQPFKCTLLSEYRANHDAFDSQHDDDHDALDDADAVNRCRTENDLKEAEDGARPAPGQRGRNDMLKKAPPLHLIPGYVPLLCFFACFGAFLFDKGVVLTVSTNLGAQIAVSGPHGHRSRLRSRSRWRYAGRCAPPRSGTAFIISELCPFKEVSGCGHQR